MPHDRSRLRTLRAWLAGSFCALSACSSTGGGHDAAPSPPRAELALATFDEVWTTVRDAHFDPDMNGVDWEAVKAELLPRAAEARTDAELHAVIAEMLGRLEQSHFVLLPREALPPLGGATLDVTPEALAAEAGFEVRIREGRALVTRVASAGAAAAAGVRPGWTLLAFDGEALAERLRDLDALEDRARRHAATALAMEIGERTVGPVGSRARLRFEDHAGAEVELELERRERDVVAHSFGTNLPTFYLRFEQEILEPDGLRVGLIHFTNWFLPMQAPIDAAIDAMRGCDAIVLDLRGNTGGAGVMVMGFAGHFFDERTELGTQTTRDGVLRYVPLPRKVDSDGERVTPFAGPVALLVDELSASASEVFAGGMQSVGRARVFGATTAGAVLPATTRTLRNGDALLYAFGDFKTANGTLLEGRGVVPDVEIPLTRAALLASGDPVLQAALAWIAAGAE